MRKILWCLGIALFLFAGNCVWAEPLHLVTEDYPPFNMRVSGAHDGNPNDPVTGISTEILKEVFKRAGIEYTIQIYPWQRAYNTALEQPGYGVFSTFRTPEREHLFQWVGPLVPNNWVLMAKASRGIKITSLDDARKYKIGAYRGDAFGSFLEQQGFTVEYTNYDHQNAQKLDAERIDLWATGNLLGTYFAKQQNISGLEIALVVKETSMSLALNKSVAAETVATLNKILQEMKDDGTLEKIHSQFQ